MKKSHEKTNEKIAEIKQKINEELENAIEISNNAIDLLKLALKELSTQEK